MMMKLTVLLLATVSLAMAQSLLPGGYTDKPELVNDKVVLALTSFAAEKIALGQNLFLKNLQVVRVQIQIVAGTNYKIDFVAEPTNGAQGQTTRCQVVIYLALNGSKSLSQSQCQTS